ncbi:hypothetical protein ACWGID_21530 [Kribbella sp. NPDC054772]
MHARSLAVTRRSLHGVAELLLAGPQHRQGRGIRLRVVPGGFGTLDGTLRVAGDSLVSPTVSVRLTGTYAELAAAVGVEASRLDDVYSGGPKIAPDDHLEIDPAATRLLEDAFARGDAALRDLAPGETPTLWPEHFDVGVSIDKVNYGVSPGDDDQPEPYAYVGLPTPRTGEFWNAPFGAVRPLSELAQLSGIREFFGTARSLLDN